jgi:peptidyl-Asp metalloendopeptidase
MRRSGVFILAGALLLPALAAAGEQRLLVPIAPGGQEPDRVIPRSIGVMRARAVGVDLTALPGADGASALPAPGQTIQLDLFDDVSLQARMVRAERIDKGMAWVGQLEGQPMSNVVLVVYDGILSGSVTWPDDAYRIRFDGTNSVVEQLDESQFPEDHCFEELPAGVTATTPAAAAEPTAAADDGSLIDVLVVYTPAARIAAGGTSAMQSLINLAVTETNTGYANSGVIQRLRLVGPTPDKGVEVSYTEVDYSTDLNRVTGTSDGYMDNVHVLRNTYKADEVVFIGEGYAASGICGVSWLMAGNDPSFAPNAFALVDRTCATGYYSFGHEMGHNMGLNHARDDPTGTGAYSYSYGYKWTGYRTVMAYAPGTRILYFSNPNVSYLGNPTGVVQTSPSSAYNALSLNNTRVTVANWRVATMPQVTVAAPNGGESWLAGSVHTISWTSANLDAAATIKLSYTNGTSTYTIASGLARTATSYDWTVASTSGSNWKVNVCSEVSGVCEAQDASDAAFSITLPPVVAVVMPNGGESFPAGSIQALSWTAANLNATATIKLTYTDGTTTKAIASGLARTTTSYNWTVPDDQASNWKLTVCSDVGGSCEAQDSSDASFSITAVAAPAARHDLNGDTEPDLLWHHQKSGAVYAWFMNGITQTSGAFLTPSSVAPVWQVRGIGDMNLDGKNDILWQNQSTGAPYLWVMNGTAEAYGTYLTPSSVSPVWQIQGLADFNSDGKLDVLWRNTSTGQLYVWFMNGPSQVNGSFLTPSAAANAWQVRALADFDANGTADILWQNQSTGQLYVWFMNGTTQSSGTFLTPSAVANTAWKIVQADDVNADGKPDILWQNQSTGQLYVWLMNGTTQASGSFLSPSQVADLNWKVVPR